MVLNIPDDVVQASGRTEQELRVEIACRLFAAETIDLVAAGKLAGLSRPAMEEALRSRGIGPYRVTDEMLEEDLRTLDALRKGGHGDRRQ